MQFPMADTKGMAATSMQSHSSGGTPTPHAPTAPQPRGGA